MEFKNWIEEQNLQEFNWRRMLGTAALTAGLGGAAILGNKNLNKNKIPKQINKKNIIKNDEKIEKKDIKKIDNSISTDEFMRFIEPHEGRRNKSYKDTRGFKTVGVGLNLDAPGARQRIQSVGADFDRIYSGKDLLSDEQIDSLFRQDVERHLEIARRQFPTLNEMPRSVQLVIVDMIFNLGSLNNFPRLREALNSGNWNQAADEMEGSRWYRQVGNRSRELVNLMRNVR